MRKLTNPAPPSDFTIITREPGEVSEETRQQAWQLFNGTIDAFLASEEEEDDDE